MERMRNLNSGLGQFCLNLGGALAALPEQDCHFEACLPGQLSGVFGDDFSYRPVRKWQKITGVQTQSDLWHGMHQDSAYFPQNRRTRLSMTIHDLNFLERSDYGKQKKARKTAQLQQRINRCTGLVYVSQFVREQVHANLNIPAGIHEKVAYNGVHAPEVQQTAQQKEKAPYLFSIGLHPKKNYAAVLPVLQVKSNWKWVIAGSDNKGYSREILTAAEQLGVDKQLVFSGVVTEEEKWNLYAGCEALLFPSLAEGFGLPVIEAMSFGKPVFLSTRTSLPEIGGSEAYYFESFDPEEVVKTFQKGMSDFNEDPGKIQRLKSWAARFTWESAAKEYLDFFQTILQTGI